jgi:hypothetical protein
LTGRKSYLVYGQIGSKENMLHEKLVLFRGQVMYVNPNLRSKKAVKEAIAAGKTVTVFSPGQFPCPKNGQVSVEGPHYPEPHKWYGTVTVVDGIVTSIK